MRRSPKRKKTIQLNKPYPSTRRDKKKMVYVLNPRTGRVNIIHFGKRGYKNNQSRSSWKKYMKRSAGIRDSRGRLTKNNVLSANYWSRRVLWSGRKWRRR